MPANVILASQLLTSLAPLAANDQVRVIDFINTFRANPGHPSLRLERLQGARSKGLWSGRVSRDLRVILLREGALWALLYADHHDAAYRWAKRREIGRHGVTGALQIVESVETVREIQREVEIPVRPEAPPTFDDHDDAYLLSLGVPESWLPTIRKVRDDDQLLAVCERLPDDVAERLVALAAGEFVTPPEPVPADRSPVEAPDTLRRFYVVEDTAGLAAILEAPLDRWIAFLHPTQRALVEREFAGPVKVSGAAGTGKTVVAMHRARHLARRGERVLLTSYVTTLCRNLERNLAKLCTEEERSRITVSTVHHEALALVRRVQPGVRPASSEEIGTVLDALRRRHAPSYDLNFVRAEWDHVVRLQGIASWDAYRRARRTGRGRGLSVRERKILWRVFGGILEHLDARGLVDWPGLCQRASTFLSTGRVPGPYTAVIVDEVQDLTPPELRFVKALCTAHPGNLMLCGDTGQRIYPGGFSLRALGIETRGRSTVLRINYRTTEQIRRLADRMLGAVCDDMDGGRESRTGTRSLLRGPAPRLTGYDSEADETAAAVDEVRRWLRSGIAPEAIGVFARTRKRVEALAAAFAGAGIPVRMLLKTVQPTEGGVQMGTMHRAKGLEFKAVWVAGCSEAVLPHPKALADSADPLDREAAQARERRLLYVAMTRARDELAVSWSGRPSPYLAHLLRNDGGGT